ncbi:ureidoglycolate dehydrogenase [Bacillus sp. V3-13]|uniref:ureidoglycolate dehydrogenase n=1 Tax=Bacillus sp. V3-13 TaxID=2053728 RepID=UPI000C79121C|nr:ureidoglycolate dehydrogenase [Bacillus sp. V3-13]PLR76770.1 ureidoglycolate dehydrogenase [Bacillus sp. V3-13]
MQDVKVSPGKLAESVILKLTKAGLSESDATIVADVLVHADLRGVSSHGVLRTEHYVKRISEGGINPTPEFSIKDTGPVTAIFDGDNGMGHVIAKEAMNYAIKLAEKNGVGMVGVINSSHCGALSYFVQQAAESKIIGMAMTHTDKVVVPFGGAKPYFGTNPIAFGFPSKSKPLILDMATSNVAYGKILHAREAGATTIPSDWGVDEQGNPTSDPNQVAALLPFAGPKGYGLAMVVDIFSGILTGSAFGPHVSKMYGDYTKKRELGHFVCAINPAFFTSIDSFIGNIEQMTNEIHEMDPANGFGKVMVPGEPENLREEANSKEGIPLKKSLYGFLMEDEFSSTRNNMSAHTTAEE